MEANDESLLEEEKVVTPLKSLCLDVPLYSKITELEGSAELAQRLVGERIQFDAYCVNCKTWATFKRDAPYKAVKSIANNAAITVPIAWPITVKPVCTRHSHIYQFVFSIYDGGIAKIGQSPSAADIGVGDLVEFRGLLAQSDFRELHKADGLVSHGAAIGAFAYLRRVFEQVIEAHRLVHEAERGVIVGYERMRMADRIRALGASLPAGMSSNPAIYSIMSKGIHELDEDVCAEVYPLMRATLVMILRQDAHAKRLREEQAALQKAISAVAATYN